jgi:hypothetical protein
MALKVFEGCLMLNDTVGGSRVTVLNDETAIPIGTLLLVSGSTCATVTTTTAAGTFRMMLRTSSFKYVGPFEADSDCSEARLPSFPASASFSSPCAKS